MTPEERALMQGAIAQIAVEKERLRRVQRERRANVQREFERVVAESRAKREAARRENHRRIDEALANYSAVPTSRCAAILERHADVDGECAVCYAYDGGGDGRVSWPCDVVEAVMEILGVEVG